MYKVCERLFKNKEELFNLGVDGLYKIILNNIKDINLEKYILDFGRIPNKYAELLGYPDEEQIIEKYSRKNAKLLIDDNLLYNLCNNIINQAKDSSTLVGKMFYSEYYQLDKDLNFRFNVEQYKDSKHYTIDFSLLSLYKGTGGGDGFRILLTNSNVIEEEVSKVNQSNLQEETKAFIIDEFRNKLNTDSIDFKETIKDAKEGILDSIDYYIEDCKEKFSNYKSLQEQQFHKNVFDDYFNDWMHNFDREIEFKYRNENILDVYFCNELIKTIKKISYTAYDIY